MIWKYLYNYLVMLSQLASVVLGGDPDESISQRTARAYIWHKAYNHGSFKQKWFSWQLEAIDLMFYNKIWKIEQNHCFNSLDGEKTSGEVWDWNNT